MTIQRHLGQGDNSSKKVKMMRMDTPDFRTSNNLVSIINLPWMISENGNPKVPSRTAASVLSCKNPYVAFS